MTPEHNLNTNIQNYSAMDTGYHHMFCSHQQLDIIMNALKLAPEKMNGHQVVIKGIQLVIPKIDGT